MNQYVFLDSTVFGKGKALSDLQLQRIARASAAGEIRVALSRVTLLEVERQIQDEVRIQFSKLDAAAQTLARLRVPIEPFHAPPANVLASMTETWIEDSKFEVLEIPEVPHADLVSWDLARRAPFDKDGKGYRDALIWRSFVGWVDQPPILSSLGQAQVFFVTANERDFVANKDLHETLRNEVTDGVDVVWKKDLSELLLALNLPAPLTAEKTAETVALEFLDHWVDAGIHPTSWHVDGVEVEDMFVIDIQPFSTETNKIATDDLRTDSWEVRVQANVDYEGCISKSDLSLIDELPTISIQNFDHNRHYSSISGWDLSDFVIHVDLTDANILKDVRLVESSWDTEDDYY